MKKKLPIPRLGFLGTGWIGRHRMKAIHDSGEAEVRAIADISRENAQAAAKIVSTAEIVESLEDLLAMDLDGIVIATPSACHCSQAIQALDQGMAVFCQKPLGRNALETELVVAAARKSDRLLSVDFSYRFTEGIEKMYDLVHRGEIGEIYTADLVFHNAYGPDKPWFYNVKLSGGGCLMDLGSHLMDLALWFFDFPVIKTVSSSIFSQGREMRCSSEQVEDYAVVSMTTETGSIIRLACSWNLSAGQDAVIESSFFGTKGGVCFKNVNGSFYDFKAERFHGTCREILADPPDEWGGKAAVAWSRELRSNGGKYDAAAERLICVATALDAAYGR